MSFFDKVKRAMGFDPSDDDYMEEEGIDATVTPLKQRRLEGSVDNGARHEAASTLRHSAESTTVSRPVPSTAETPEPAEVPDSAVIFETVVGIFNESLPDFLKKSVDPEKQRHLLYEALDSSVKSYFDQMEKMVEKRISHRNQAEHQKLYAQIEELRENLHREVEGNSNAKNLQLSAERQKRALSERVHELEKQIASLQADNEQYILENKTMANKLRVISVTDRDGSEALDEMNRQLSDALEKQKEAEQLAVNAEERARTAEEALANAEEQIAKAEQIMAENSRHEDDTDESFVKLTQEYEQLSKESKVKDEKLAELQEETARLREAVEQAKAKDELSRVMVNDLNAIAAEARKTATDKDTKIEELTAQNSQLAEKLAQSDTRLQKAMNDLQVVREVQEQVKMFEKKQLQNDAELRRVKDELLEKDELIKARESDITAKNTTLRMKDETIHRLEDQTDSLRRSVENLQYEKSQMETTLRTEIERLKSLKGLSIETDVTRSDNSYPADMPEIDIVIASEPAEEEHDLPELVATVPSALEKPKPRRGRPPKQQTAVDENVDTPVEAAAIKDDTQETDDIDLLDNTDWLIATPEPAKVKRQRRQKSDSDDSFGYKEPVRQDPPDNPAQMLLW